MNCIYCNHYILYNLKDGNLKCAKCKRKFSPKKIIKKESILNYFLDQYTPSQIAKKTNISYSVVVKDIKFIRQIMAKICEENFLEKETISEFEEYLYIPNNNIYKAENFLTIDYGKIYNILLSDMKNYENLTQKEIKNLFLQSRLIKYQNHIQIQNFWDYFEPFIKKFRGINKKNFFLYLKESEFRFNNFNIDIYELFRY